MLMVISIPGETALHIFPRRFILLSANEFFMGDDLTFLGDKTATGVQITSGNKSDDFILFPGRVGPLQEFIPPAREKMLENSISSSSTACLLRLPLAQ